MAKGKSKSNMRFQRVGILGGTFNPIHIGHLVMAQHALEQLRLQKVIFVPTYLPPHKRSSSVILAKHRFKMVQLAIKGHPYFDISDCEIVREGKSYSIDTVRMFRTQLPKNIKLFFILGEDSLNTLHTWRRIDDLLEMVTFVAAKRSGQSKIKPKIKVNFINMPVLDIASSDLRKRIAVKKTVEHLVPDNVLKYIQKRNLYK